jgi:uncharacterized membrane protein
MAEPPIYVPFQEAPPPPRAGVDPVSAGFDRLVALGGYGLLFAAIFTFGASALAALALALFHRDDAQPLIRGHYRFQIRIFLIALLLLILSSMAALLGGGLALGQAMGFVELRPGQVAAAAGGGQAWTAGGLVLAAVLFAGLSALWTLAASGFGFLRLIANRPIGHGVYDARTGDA